MAPVSVLTATLCRFTFFSLRDRHPLVSGFVPSSHSHFGQALSVVALGCTGCARVARIGSRYFAARAIRNWCSMDRGNRSHQA